MESCKMKYQRVLIKLSGEALSGDKGSGIIDSKALLSTAKVIASIVKQGVEVSLVIGAGNIARGSIFEKSGIDRISGDKMGMLGTVINSLAMEDALKKLGIDTVVLSAVSMPSFLETYTKEAANKYLSEKKVVIFAGGTGKPFFTTDTCATLRAIETSSDAILMAKNGVDGIYDDDPRINKNAKMFKNISCSTIIQKDLKVMDISAVKLLKNQDINVCVFNMSNPENFLKVINGEDIGTTIIKG